MALNWVVADFVTGRIQGDLVDLSFSAPLAQTINQPESVTATLPLPTAPIDWELLTTPMAKVFAAQDDAGNVKWAGLLLGRPRTEGDALQLPLATGEAYFDLRYVSPLFSGSSPLTPDYGFYSDVDQCALGADLVSRYVASTSSRPGMPIRINAGTSAQPGVTHTYADADDMTVLACLQALAANLNGPEFTVTWEVQTSPSRITPVFNIADRLGSSPPAGKGPQAVFYLPGPVLSMSWNEDYSKDKGANDVTAVGDGTGGSRPSARSVATDLKGRPTVEMRFKVPTTGTEGETVAQIAALQAYADRALGYLQDGTQTLALTVAANDPVDGTVSPAYGTDWVLGDDIGYQIGGMDDDGGDITPAFPGGRAGSARAIGVQLTDTTETPVIFAPNPTQTAGDF